MTFQEMLSRVRRGAAPVAVCAHRGDSAHAPENTVAAFELAIRNGADAIEFDVQYTADGQTVVFHDDELDRTTNGRGKVRSSSLEAIRGMDAGGWFSADYAGERVPTLDQALEVMKGRVVPVVEVKGRLRPASERASERAQRKAARYERTGQRLDRAAAALEERERWEESGGDSLEESLAHRAGQGGLPARVLRRIDRALERRLGRGLPHLRGGVDGRRRRLEARRARLERARAKLEAVLDRMEYSRAYVEAVVRAVERHDLVGRAILVVYGFRAVEMVREVNRELAVSVLTYTRRGARDALRREDVDGVDPRWQSLDADLVRRFHAGGKFLTPWTVNDPATMRRLVEMGSDAVITDDPALLRDAIDGYQVEWLLDCRRLIDSAPAREEEEDEG
ncbi:MAG: hypothetical protein HY722_11795 [Planctomycetes bacterium]|nr:hypothetical protein [Planctomycetota bacterium]